MEDIAKHVAGDLGHADLHRRPADANGADEELHLVLLPGEDMLEADLLLRCGECPRSSQAKTGRMPGSSP